MEQAVISDYFYVILDKDATLPSATAEHVAELEILSCEIGSFLSVSS